MCSSRDPSSYEFKKYKITNVNFLLSSTTRSSPRTERWTWRWCSLVCSGGRTQHCSCTNTFLIELLRQARVLVRKNMTRTLPCTWGRQRRPLHDITSQWSVQPSTRWCCWTCAPARCISRTYAAWPPPCTLTWHISSWGWGTTAGSSCTYLTTCAWHWQAYSHCSRKIKTRTKTFVPGFCRLIDCARAVALGWGEWVSSITSYCFSWIPRCKLGLSISPPETWVLI